MNSALKGPTITIHNKENVPLGNTKQLAHTPIKIASLLAPLNSHSNFKNFSTCEKTVMKEGTHNISKFNESKKEADMMIKALSDPQNATFAHKNLLGFTYSGEKQPEIGCGFSNEQIAEIVNLRQ